MSTRKSLKKYTELRCINHDKSTIIYTIQNEIGRGGSCIVYDAYYINNAGKQNPVRIKECYPFKLNIVRDENGQLTPVEWDNEKFNQYKQRLKESFEISNELFTTSGLTNSIANPVDIYETNNTIYIVTSYLEGETISSDMFRSLKECVTVVKSTAKAIKMIHDKGYLYLDIKPDNIFVLNGTLEIVQLFDFDSLIPIDKKDEIGNYRLSYSKGFAPLEQRLGQFKNIDKYTDVFGVGALLFYLIFGKAPYALECDITAKYDYSMSKYAMDEYKDKLCYALNTFFHHTLPSYYPDRYQDLEATIAGLSEIEKYADLSIPYILDSYISSRDMIFGRDDELNQLNQWISNDKKKCMFVTGMGGIGKSTLLREWLTKDKKIFDTVLYLHYYGSIQDMITDDEQLCINTVEKTEEENTSDYFKRKLIHLRKIIEGIKSIIVIDDFDGIIGEDFLEILNIGWKVVVITRADINLREYDIVKVLAIKDKIDLQRLFVENLGREIEKDEIACLDIIIDTVSGHTLILELIAKQIANSYLTIEDAVELVKENGFANIAPEKVEYLKDGQLNYERISSIITALFSAEQMQSNKKVILKTLSLFHMPGIDINIFMKMLKLESKDDLNELKTHGWINIENGMISIHPVIRETIREWEWNSEFQNVALLVLNRIFIEIKFEGKKEDYPKKLQERNQKLKIQLEKNGVTKKIIDYMVMKKGVIGEVTLERILHSNESQATNQKILNKYLRLSEGVLDSCKKVTALHETNIYKDLLYSTIINTPRDREEYIMAHSEELFSDATCTNTEALIKLYDYVVYIHCAKEEFELAYDKIMHAKKIISKHSSNHLWGLYYDMEAEYYDALLNGAYDAQSEEEVNILQMLFTSIDYAIRYMRKSRKPNSKQFLAKYLLSKANIMIRSFPEDKVKIRELIDSAKKLVQEYTLEYSDVRTTYNMACAWYYTLSEPDYKRTIEFIQEAYEIAKNTTTTELDDIDYIIVPCANMLVECEKYDEAATWLKIGIKICNSHDGSLPYIRKKMDLFSYLLDVYYFDEDKDNCFITIEQIDKENEINKELGIVKEIPDELRNEICSLK